ncbi:hypothetical protein EG329_000493 [Mollisiaceae sp. DMI_Dod_QoI]|nr:hypothetical protein EG329_000493 [Helotiales sp. DMI_Dod_QoI]
MWAGPFLSADLEVAAGSPATQTDCSGTDCLPGWYYGFAKGPKNYSFGLWFLLPKASWIYSIHGHVHGHGRAPGPGWRALPGLVASAAMAKANTNALSQILRSPVDQSRAQQHHVCCSGHGTFLNGPDLSYRLSLGVGGQTVAPTAVSAYLAPECE